ncbi:MAG: peptide chain release factor N(5)-glutamine methyltransferase [Deltaproteobacteria bacterium]|nr:peptide chain release factor N(5)-glutamine methyltransferase [Deltaproteobacteria bacterium]
MKQQEIWTTLKVLNWTKEFLAVKGVENARLEAEWLLCAATGLDRVGLYLNFEKPLNDSELSSFRAMVARRGRREPLQHILGTQEFCGLEFEVTPDILIPRHDTETLVNEAASRKTDARTLLDIGTGSGCIAIALARQLPVAAVTATDISAAALAVARRNAERHGVAIEFLQGSLFMPVTGRRFDLIVSNPPYISSEDIAGLEPEVRDYDPHSALDGGRDGLDVYRLLVPDAREYLNPGGCLLLEVGIGQADDIIRLIHESGGYEQPFTASDPGGVMRVVGAQRRDNA